MHFQPTPTELADLPEMPFRERILYFLTRAIECEEVWGHADDEGWILGEEDGKTILRVWSYQVLASDCLEGAGLKPESLALERFIEVLEGAQETIHLEILPMPQRPGALIEAGELLSMLEGMMDSGSYFMEG
jgi:hypothetical protein